MPRPSHVHCIRRYHVSEHHLGYCGRDISMEFSFLDPAHAAHSWERDGLQTCAACVAVFVPLLKAASARAKTPKAG